MAGRQPAIKHCSGQRRKPRRDGFVHPGSWRGCGRSRGLGGATLAAVGGDQHAGAGRGACVCLAVGWAGPDLYAAGRLGGTNDLHGDEVYRLGANSRSVLGGPFSGDGGRVFAIVAHGASVFAGGSFTNAAGQAASCKIAEWKGEGWQPVGGGLADDVRALYRMVRSFMWGEISPTRGN